jgi:hypothetical protein
MLWALSACPGRGKDDGGGAAGPVAVGLSGTQANTLRDSWMFAVAQDPGRMQPFEQATGDAWLAFYHNDLLGALAGFGPACTPSDAPLPAQASSGYACVGLARTLLELAELHRTAAEVHREALRQFHMHRDSHAEEVLASVHADYFAGVAALHSGRRDDGVARLQRYAAVAGADPALKAMAENITAGLASGDPLVARVWGGASAEAPAGADLPVTKLAALPADGPASAYIKRLGFVLAVARGEVEAAAAMQREIPTDAADFDESLEQKEGSLESAVAPSIRHHDSAWLYSLSRFHALQALAAVGSSPDLSVLRASAERLLGRASGAPLSAPGLPDGLALVIFSACPTPADLLEAERSFPARTATLARLAKEFPPLGTAPTRALGDLDPFLDVSNTIRLGLGELLKSAGPQGGNMDVDMGLAERFRGQLLRERAWQFQAAFDVRLDGEAGADVASAGVAAQSLFELALDKNPAPPNERLKAARISFRNDPAALADLARAQLDTRHPYDSNEYIRPLTEVYPELIPVREGLAALDSAWNPARKGSVR